MKFKIRVARQNISQVLMSLQKINAWILMQNNLRAKNCSDNFSELFLFQTQFSIRHNSKTNKIFCKKNISITQHNYSDAEDAPMAHDDNPKPAANEEDRYSVRIGVILTSIIGILSTGDRLLAKKLHQLSLWIKTLACRQA